jgi:sugar-specific transcriptional regulator TrmB
LESLQGKGWIRIYSGVPPLFKAVGSHAIFEKIKKDYDDFLESIQTIFDVSTMEYGTCVKCLRKTFDMGWRYSQKK